MSKQTKSKRKKLKINKSGIDHMRADKSNMKKEADEVKKILVSHLDDFLYSLGEVEESDEVFDAIIENRDFLRKAAVVAMGTKYFQDSAVKFESLLNSFKEEFDTNEKRALHVFSILLETMRKPPKTNVYYATLLLTTPAIGYFVQEYLGSTKKD